MRTASASTRSPPSAFSMPCSRSWSGGRPGARGCVRSLGGRIYRAQPALSRKPGATGPGVGRGRPQRSRRGSIGARDHADPLADPAREHAVAVAGTRRRRGAAGAGAPVPRPWARSSWTRRSRSSSPRATAVARRVGRREPARAPAARRAVALQPAVLESALLDAAQPPRAAPPPPGSSTCHGIAPAASAVTAREVYSELFLAPVRQMAAERDSRRVGGVRLRGVLDVLMDALDDTCQRIRIVACEACWGLALEHPAWFQPRHYTRLLPCLSDDDRAIRVCVMRTFQTLAGYRSRQVAAVVHRLARQESARRGDEEKGSTARPGDRARDHARSAGRRRRATAAGSPGALEARRRELLDYIETQAVRVGEEIHHEVLNALGGYLATAIDEEDYPEARSVGSTTSRRSSGES